MSVERRLEECLRTLGEVQQMAGIGSWRLEIADGRLWWSDQLYRMFGLDPAGTPVSTQLLCSLIHPEDRRTFEAQVAAAAPRRSDYRIVLPGGQVRHIHEEVRVECDERGVPVRMVGTAQDVSDRTVALQELASQRAMLQQILDTASVGVGLLDPAGRFSTANRRLAEMFGCTAQELIGSEYVEHVDASQRGEARANMRALLAGDVDSVDLDRRYRRKDGTEFWGRLTCRRFDDSQGAGPGLLGVIVDITESRRVEEQLRQSERMLQTIIEAEPECVKVLDRDGRLIMMNRAGLDMIQADALEQVQGRCVCPMIGAADRDAFMDLTRRVFEGESGTLAFEMIGAKGRRLWLETHAVPLRGENEKVVALLGVTRDITAQRAAAAALRASEARFRAIIERASSGILVAEVGSGRFQYANPEICRMLGYDADELLALSVDAIHPVEELPLVRKSFGARVGVQTRCVRKDGSVFPVEIRVAEVELDGGPRLVGFFTDTTEKALLEEERLKAQKLESIGTLAGGIAHDFNNLLQGVFGYLSMAKLSLDPRAKSSAMLEQAEKALHQSVNLTNQLLTFAKGGKPVKKAIDLRPVIENAAKFALSGSRVCFTLDLDPDLRAVDADEGQIGQVVQNLVLNAEQAMPLGGKVEISAHNTRHAPAGSPATGEGFVEITVRDHGAGIPAEQLPRIFDPYFTTKEKGSGLGLATSYAIVRNHDGLIHARSEPGKGSIFTVRLPASGAGPARAPAPAPVAGGARRKILVMDDERIVRAVAGELLGALGHEVAFAEEGAAAVAAYEAAREAGAPFDLVILDLTIRGGVGGEETARRLRQIDPGVKAVVSSGYSDDEVVATFRRHGFRAFLRKPYTIAELERVLAEVGGPDSG